MMNHEIFEPMTITQLILALLAVVAIFLVIRYEIISSNKNKPESRQFDRYTYDKEDEEPYENW